MLKNFFQESLAVIRGAFCFGSIDFFGFFWYKLTMVKLIFDSLYFLLPAYIANMCPVFAMKLSLPGAKIINEKYFGHNKTWLGFYAAYVGALATLVIQKLLYQQDFFYNNTLLDYSRINLLLYAFLFGVGALTGDLVKSFFKRRLNIAPGQPWFPFDQLDLVIGAIVFLLPFHILSWQNILVLIVLTPLLHFLSNVIGFSLGLKKVWW